MDLWLFRYDGIPAPVSAFVVFANHYMYIGILTDCSFFQNVACYTLDTQEACEQNARFAWLAFTSRCRRNRAVNGKTSKRLRKQ